MNEEIKSAKTYNLHKSGIEDVLWYSNEKFLSASHDNSIKHYDMVKDIVIGDLEGVHEEGVWAIEKIENRIFSTSSDGFLKINDLRDNKLIQSIKCEI